MPADLARPGVDRERRSARADAAGRTVCHTVSHALTEIEAVIEGYQLLTRPLRQRSGTDETMTIGSSANAISQCQMYAEIPGMLAHALADGLSLVGAGEALSIGAAGLFLLMHTSVHLRRYLVQLVRLYLRNKLLSLHLWHTGPEVRSTQRRMEPSAQPDPDAVAALPYRTPAEIACHDNFTETHAFKHHQAIVEEYYATREPWRSRHLVAGAQAAM